MRNVVHGVDSHLIPKAKQARYTDPKFVDPEKNDGSAFTATELRRQRIRGRIALDVRQEQHEKAVEKQREREKLREQRRREAEKIERLRLREAAREMRREKKTGGSPPDSPGAAPGSPGAQVSHRGSSGTSRQPGTPRMAGSKVHAERQALALASAGEAALLSELERAQAVVSALEQGRMPREFEERFMTRHNRVPTPAESSVTAALHEEKKVLSVLRHEAANANCEVLEAEAALLVRERSVAEKGIKQWETRRKRQKGSKPDAEEKANNVEYQKLLKLIAGCDKALKQIEKRYGKARGRERMWPGQHWQRSQDRSAAEAGDTDEEEY